MSILVTSEMVSEQPLFYNVEFPFIKFCQSQTWKTTHHIKSSAARRVYDYRPAVSGNKPPPAMCIIIPVYGRSNHLKQSVLCLSDQISKVSDDVVLVVAEMSEKSEHRELCTNLNIDYVFVESAEFNKSQVMNVAAANYPAENFMFYDVDLITGPRWLERCMATIHKLKQEGDSCYIVQPIEERKIFYVSENLTNDLFQEKCGITSILKDTNHLVQPEWYKKNYPPGGVVIVSANLMYAVQGYDPALYWGYSPEDKFFMDRCVDYSNKGELVTWNMLPGSGTDVYHLYHSNSENTNKAYEHMVFVSDMIKFSKPLHSWYSEDKVRWNSIPANALQILENGGNRFGPTITAEVQDMYDGFSGSFDEFEQVLKAHFSVTITETNKHNPALAKVRAGYIKYLLERKEHFFRMFISK